MCVCVCIFVFIEIDRHCIDGCCIYHPKEVQEPCEVMGTVQNPGGSRESLGSDWGILQSYGILCIVRGW